MLVPTAGSPPAIATVLIVKAREPDLTNGSPSLRTRLLVLVAACVCVAAASSGSSPISKEHVESAIEPAVGGLIGLFDPERATSPPAARASSPSLK